MFLSNARCGALGLSLLAGVPASAPAADAAVIDVGTGDSSAYVVFNFFGGSDRFVVEYNVRFSQSSIDGYTLTQLVDDADPQLSLQWVNFGTDQDPSYFLNAANYGTEYVGDGSEFVGEDWWHEWISNPATSGWTWGNGASADSFSNGDKLGWVFGTAAAPVPEPAAVSLLVASGCMLLARRRRAA